MAGSGRLSMRATNILAKTRNSACTKQIICAKVHRIITFLGATMFKKAPLLMAIALTITATCTTQPEPTLYKQTTLLPAADFKFLLEQNLITLDELSTLLGDGKPQPNDAENAILIKTISERHAMKQQAAAAQQKELRYADRIKQIGYGCLGGILGSIPWIVAAIFVHSIGKRQNAAAQIH